MDHPLSFLGATVQDVAHGVNAMKTAFPTLRVNPLRLTDAEVAFYKNEGYLVLPGLLPTDMAAALREEVYEVLAANGFSRERLGHASSTADKLRQCGQYLAGSLLDQLINGPEVRAIAARLIEGPAHMYLPFTAVKAAGGGGQFHFHQDNNYTQHEPALGSINIWVAMVDMTPDNGCLLIVPRSHLQGQLASRNSDDGDAHQQLDVDPLTALPIRMRAGDAVAFTRLTVHGSGPNLTSEPRVAYALQYHRADVKWFDRATNEWKLLVENPRWATPPVSRLGP